jgi:hypothetical protein
MDLLDKAEEIAMTNLSILYNINPVPLAICAPFPLGKLEQQWPDVEKSCWKKIHLFRQEKKGGEESYSRGCY